MIFRELSNAAFRFSLRRPGAEIMGGGGVQTPPPPAGGGKSRGPAGRGFIVYTGGSISCSELQRAFVLGRSLIFDARKKF